MSDKGLVQEQYLQRGKPRSRHRASSKQGGSGGAQPPQHCKRIVERIGIQFASIFDPILSKIHLPKAFHNNYTFCKIWIKWLPKWSKIEVWRGSGELLGGSGAALGRHLAPRPLWAASWVRFGQLLVGSGSFLGAFWAALWPSWAASWGVLGRLAGILEASCSDFWAPSHSLSSAFYFDRLWFHFLKAEN